MTKKDVHIVYNPNKDDIISRLMVTLSESTQWTISKHARQNADINYFGLYVSVAQGANQIPALKKKGKVAAWFSHYEETRPEKQAWWEQAAQLVDIRLTCAPQYIPMLEKYGETHLVIPPIDKQFKPLPEKKVIGVSGFVHPGGRKGEHLVSELNEMATEYNWHIKASGKGWNVKDMEMREWDQMPDFYRSLDVYLVTSFVEGIPMPPLEALACGIPIVVPKGVGMLDYITGSHVYRYTKGDIHSMIDALQLALYPSIATYRYSASTWAETHKIAFGLTDSDPIVLSKAESLNTVQIERQRNESYSIPNAGAVIIAYGEPARECAKESLSSWRKEMPDYPVALISDSPLGIETLFIEHPDTDIGARSIKTKLYELVPEEWNYILYLDADTEIVNDVSILFKWLELGFDFLICTNPVYYKTLEQGMRPDNIDETEFTIDQVGSGDIPQPNGGIIAYTRNVRMQSLFKSWYKEWQLWGKRDQQALIRAMRKQPLRWLLLNNIWNTITRYDDPPIEESGGILHHPMQARRWEGIIEGRLDSPEAWGKVKK